jgi:hypothetical protein
MIDEFDELMDSPAEENSFENEGHEHTAPFFDENGNRFSTSGKILLLFPEGTAGRVEIPEGTEHLSADAFKLSGAVTELVIPSTLKTLHHNVFRKLSRLRSFSVHPDNIDFNTDSEGQTLFNHDITKIIKVSCDCDEAHFPNGVSEIGNYAFQHCEKITNIVVPDTVTNVGTGAFAHCHNLRDITLGSKTKKIPGWLFMDCPALEQITIPDSVKRLGTGAFAQCSNLKSVHLPDTLQAINGQCFADCVSLETIFLPIGVKSVGTGAFDGCQNLAAIDVDEDNAKLCSENGLLYNKYQSQLLRCPEGSRSFDLPELLSSLAPSAFAGCRHLTSIALPVYIINIPEYCFSDCAELQSVSLPPNLISIGHSAFEGCRKLKEISLPPTLQSIGDYAFSGCAAIEHIDLPQNLSEIGSSNPKENQKCGCSFYGCYSLKELSVPDKVSSLNEYCFGNCTSLQTIRIPYLIDYLNNDLFAGCDSLRRAILANPYTEIEEGTFSKNVEIIFDNPTDKSV